MLYYGDEIGMGDVIWLGDRDGVRTPMQWTPDRNAGFSTANPGRLYVPPSQDPVYGYQTVNVEAQRDTSTSLLNWTRTMLAVRRRHDAFAIGTFEEMGGSNPSVLAYVREADHDVVEHADPDHLADLFESQHLILGLAEVLLESFLEFGIGRSAGEFRQGLCKLRFGAVCILQQVAEHVLQVSHGHG